MTPPSPSSLLASFQEHYDDLLSFLTRRLRDRHRAADVAQETWIKLAKIDPEAVTVLNDRHFIFKVAGNLAIEALRVDQRQTRNLSGEPPSLQIADPGLPPEGLLLATERIGILDDALQQLSPNARQALLLSRIDGMTQAQIAVELGVSPSMVAKYIGQALRHCRDWLKHNHA